MEDIILKYEDKEIKVLIHYFHNQIFYEKLKQKGSFSFSDQFLKIKWESLEREEVFVKSDNQSSDIFTYEYINNNSEYSLKKSKNTFFLIHTEWQDLCVCFESVILRKSSKNNKGYYKIEEIDNEKYLTIEWENWGREVFIQKDYTMKESNVFELYQENKSELINHDDLEHIQKSNHSVSEIDKNESNNVINLIHPSWKDSCLTKKIDDQLFVERLGVSDEKGNLININDSTIYKIEWEKWDEEYFVQWSNKNDFYHSSFINCIKVDGIYYLVNCNLEQIFYKNKIIPCGITKKECFLNHTQYNVEPIDIYIDFINKINDNSNLLEPIYLSNNLITSQSFSLNLKYSSEKYLLNQSNQWKNCLFIINIETTESLKNLEFLFQMIHSKTFVYIFMIDVLYNKIKLDLPNYNIENIIIQPIKYQIKNCFEQDCFLKNIFETIKEKKNDIYIDSVLYINLENFIVNNINNIRNINTLLSTNYPKYWDCFFYTKNGTFIEPFKISIQLEQLINSIECLSDLIMFFIMIIIVNKIKKYQIKNLSNNFVIWFHLKNIEYFQSEYNIDFKKMNLKTILI